MNKKDVFLSGPDLVKLFEPYLSIHSLTTWVGNAVVKTNENGQRSLTDTAIALCKKLGKEKERLKAEVSPSGDDLREEIDKARLRKLLLEGDIIELQRDRENGELIRLDVAIAERKDTDARIKQKLLSLPSRVALELSSISSPVEIQKALDDYIREVLLELHTELYGGGDGVESKDSDR